MIYNHIPVKIGCLPKVTAAPINFQYDQVQVLQIEGIELPTSYRVDFCNPGDAATITMVGTADGVEIPNQLLATGRPVIAYIVLNGTDENAVETRYQITLPVNKRPPASDIQPTPAEQSTIDSLIEAMNDAVDAAEDAQAAAELAQDGAETAETGAEAQALKAEGYAVGTQDGTPVSSDSPYYENNAEYMRDAAAQYALAADASEGEAAAWATGSYSGDPSGIPVPDDAPQHNNNAHYYKEQAAASAAAAEAALEQFTTPTASASTLPTGSSATASYNNGNFAFGIPKGDKGDPGTDGTDGTDGVSPEVTITSITGGHTVKITDADHPTGQSFNVMNGTDGTDGTDGVSPEVTITSITGGHTVKITDADHPTGQSFNVMDGEDGVSPEVTITSITGGHTVKITDADHPTGQSFNVMDGANTDADDVTYDPTETYTAGSVGAGLNQLNSEINDLTNNKAPIITDTASGAIATFPDGADGLPVKQLTVAVNPVQDLHGYDSPWPAGGGKNKFGCADGTYAIGSTRTATVADGVWAYKVNSAATSSIFLPEVTVVAMAIPALPAGTYTFSLVSNAAASSVIASAALNLSDGQAITNGNSFTISADTSIISITTSIRGQYAAGTYTCQIQIESGSTATAWTPYSNECPISGWTGCEVTSAGKNLIDESTATIYPRYFNNTNAWLYNTESASFAFKCLPNTTYSVSAYNSNITIFRVGYIKTELPTSTSTADAPTAYNVTKLTSPGSAVVTTGADATYVVVQVSYSIATARTTQLQIEYGSTPTAYEAGHVATLSITFPDAAGTVYGAELTINEDGTGKLISRLKAFIYSEVLYYGTYQGHPLYYMGVPDYSTDPIKKMAVVSDAGTLLCDRFVKTTASNTKYMLDLQIRTEDTEIPTKFYFRYDEVADLATLNAELANNPMIVVAELATPQVYNLTIDQVQTLLGTNNIWSDTGNVEVNYRADTKLYLEKLTAPTEDDLVADHAIASGTFFMIGNTLYKATAAIANGAAITIGTNATQLSLADALNLINA